MASIHPTEMSRQLRRDLLCVFLFVVLALRQHLQALTSQIARQYPSVKIEGSPKTVPTQKMLPCYFLVILDTLINRKGSGLEGSAQ